MSLTIFAKDIKVIYFAQIIHGIGSGLAYPIWLGLWSTNLDKRQESFEWSLYSTFIGIGVAISAAIGATIAQFFGFTYTFMFVGIMSLIGCFILFRLEDTKKLEKISMYHYTKKRKSIHRKYH